MGMAARPEELPKSIDFLKKYQLLKAQNFKNKMDKIELDSLGFKEEAIMFKIK